MNETQQPLNALPQGHRLQEYELVRVLGFGGFGMTYLGFDHNLDKAVAIKEYLPSDIAIRTGDNSVVPQASQFLGDFEWGLDRFLDEARALARFDHRHIIKVHRFFEAHGTAYIVMEYAEGETLSAFLERKGTLEESELKAILYPILDGLEVVHGADFLHRDIKPGNIIIRDEDNSPVLLDFGSARQAMGVKSRSVTSIITPGYAPIEQYLSRGDQGPWTDIYALGGICYRALTGQVPDDVTDRMRDDPLIPVSERCADQASAEFLSAIDWALQVDEANRPQSIGAWCTALVEETPGIGNAQPSVTASVPALPLEEQKRETVDSIAGRQPDAFPSERERWTRGKLLAVVISVVAVLIVGKIYIDQAEKQRQELAVLEKQRQELATEKARLAAEQAEKRRQEQVALEKQRQEQVALEKQRQEQAVLEKQRQELATEKARLAAEQAERQRQEQAALETETTDNPFSFVEVLQKNPDEARKERERAVLGGEVLPQPRIDMDNRKTRALERGGLQLSTYAWDYAPYMQYLKRHIDRHISPPRAFQLGIIDGTIRVKFRIWRDGRLEGPELIDYEGHNLLRDTSLKAVELSAPFKALPPDFPDEYLEIVGTFEYLY